ncbi:MAG TPA: hypothetical protein VHU91_03195 [Mycobacteriales bacterium]|nr:hypothetical protein [Mycobacteriales bacterium]
MPTTRRRFDRKPHDLRMWRIFAAAILTVIYISTIATSAAAAPSIHADAKSDRTVYGAPTKECVINDARLNRLTGYAEANGRRFAINAGSPATAYLLDDSCKISEAITLKEPVSNVQDLVGGPDGRLWIADIGASPQPRASVTLLRWSGFDTGSRRLELSYPDGPHDAEALLVSLSGNVVVVTRDLNGHSGVYAAQLPLPDKATLTKVGELNVAELRAGNDTSPDSLLVTGGAVSPDGTHAALRTSTAVYEWYTPDGDVASTLTKRKPHVVSLTTQTSGQAVAYSEKGDALIAISSGNQGIVESIPLRRNDNDGGGDVSLKAMARVAVGIGGVLALLLVIGVVAWRLRKRAAAVTTYQGSE